jgi:phage terminase large subunit-like protein
MKSREQVVGQLRSLALKRGLPSPAHYLASKEGLKQLAAMARTEREDLATDLSDYWPFWARHSQLPPPDNKWRIWAPITGRGWGKTRATSHLAHVWAKRKSYGFVAARTLKDARKTIIGHPTSGLLATADPENRCEFQEHKGILKWANGTQADVHTSEEPDSARGPEYEWGVADEVGTWKRTVDFQGNTTWDNLQFGLRAGPHPQMAAATTPRKCAAVRYLIEAANDPNSGVIVVGGSMLENRDNLASSFLTYIQERYGGTRLWQQEGLGRMLADVEGAIVSDQMIDDSRVDRAPDLARIVVGVDAYGGGGDACGISAAARGVEKACYVLADRTCRLGPDGWARRAIELALEVGADCIVWEANFGGEMVPTVLKHAMDNVGVSIRLQRVWSSKGKHVRFEPVGAKYERGEMHHVGTHADLEDEVTQFTPDGYDGEGSPNRADALVFAVNELYPLQPAIGWEQAIALSERGSGASAEGGP